MSEWRRVAILLVFAAAVWLSQWAAELSARRAFEAEAVAAGVARWAADPETGAPRFEWLAPKKEVRP